MAFLQLGNVMIETYESDDVSGKPGAIDHLALKARDIEAAFKAVKALGYEMVNDEIEFLPFWESGVRFFTFYGPNREKIEFSQISNAMTKARPVRVFPTDGAHFIYPFAHNKDSGAYLRQNSAR